MRLDERKNIPLESVFQALAHFEDTLVYLSMDNSFCGMSLNQGQKSLKLPHLQIFELNGNFFLENLDFLLPCKSLRQITLTSNRTCKRSFLSIHKGAFSAGSSPRTGIIKFAGIENRMYESNIWSLFPQLERLNVSVGLPIRNDAFEDVEEIMTYFYERKAYLAIERKQKKRKRN